MSLLSYIVTEPTLLTVASALVGGVAWSLKKLFDIDARLNRIEERCSIHFPKR